METTPENFSFLSPWTLSQAQFLGAQFQYCKRENNDKNKTGTELLTREEMQFEGTT